jgi:hypothetical protein
LDKGSSIRKALGSRTHRDALPLAAGKLRGLSAEIVRQFERLRRRLHLFGDRRFPDAADLQAEADVFGDRQMRVERVALKHHRDVAIARRELVGDGAADQDLAFADVLEARDHPQRRRFSASRRADENDELAVVDGQI